MNAMPEIQAPAFGGQSPFSDACKDRKSKMPILPSDQVWEQYQAKLEEERISDEEFEALFDELRKDAISSDTKASEPFDIKRAQEQKHSESDEVTATFDDGIDPDFEYYTEDGGTIDGIDVIRTSEIARATRLAENPEPTWSQSEDLTFEEAIDKLQRFITGNNRYSEILRKTLVYCKTRRALPDVEEHIQTYPEYPYAAQNPYRLIRFLIDNGGLSLLEMDEEGEIVTPERKVGLTEDEIDDLIVEFQLETTPVGEQVADNLEPNLRIAELLREFPVRFDSYKEVMEFCSEPHDIKEINALFEGRDLKVLGTMHSDTSIPIQPSVFVDKLEHAGAMYWDDAWKLTPSGRAFLEGISSFEL